MGYDGKHCGEIEMANKIVREIIHGETAAETIYRKAEQFEGILRLSKKEILTKIDCIMILCCMLIVFMYRNTSNDYTGCDFNIKKNVLKYEIESTRKL